MEVGFLDAEEEDLEEPGVDLEGLFDGDSCSENMPSVSENEALSQRSREGMGAKKTNQDQSSSANQKG
jgi:hypothetical protein